MIYANAERSRLDSDALKERVKMELFRFPRTQGETLRVRVLAGDNVLVSANNPEDLVLLQERCGVFLFRSCGLDCAANYASLPERDGCAFGFTFADRDLQPLYFQDLEEDDVVEVFPQAE